MNNLEAKQEAIKKAYYEFWENVKDYVDGNGWIKCKDIHYHKDLGLMRDQIHYIDNGKEWDNFEIISWRIPILQGIENNNGWIRIENEADLPNNEKVWICTSNNRVLISSKAGLNWVLKNPDNKITHYQPIEKPKPPIY